MKIVQINAVYGEKSTGSVVRDLDLLIQEEKNSSFVVYRDASIPAKNGIRVGNALEWKYHAFRTRIDGKQAYSSYFSTVRLIKNLEKICPDIVHLHNVHSNFLHLPALIRYVKKRKISLILTLHDCWFFTGKCYHFADIGCEKWKKECGHCPKRYMDIPSKLKDSSAKVFWDRLDLFDYEKLYVVGCSYWITSLARQSPIFKNANFCTIYNGVDTNIFCSDKKRDMNKPFTIVTMANKWFEPANDAVRKSVLNFLGDAGRLLIIGCSAEKKGIYNNNMRIEAIGYVRNRKELASLYTQGDVFLNLTHIDNLPTVNMEALSCGTPVVTYDSGGSGELVSEGITGYIVSLDDVDGIVAALDKVREGRISRKTCREYALENFDKQKNYDKYMELYSKITGKMEDRVNEPNV